MSDYELVSAQNLIVGEFYRGHTYNEWWQFLGYTDKTTKYRVHGHRKYDSNSKVPNSFAYLLPRELQRKLEEKTMTNTLYQIKGTEKYGYQLATNSAGQAVMEIKGSGETLAVNKDQIEEVIPYSVGVKYLGGGSTFHFQAEKGTFELGDVVYSTDYDNPMIVSELDTKSKRATKKLTGSVVRATKVVEG